MEYKDLIKFRSSWMGFSILWIMIYHTEILTNHNLMDGFIKLGYAGCDIFFFASGIGMYYSLTKNNNMVSFFKKRFLRVLPEYIMILFIWIPFRMYYQKLNIYEVIGNIFGYEVLIDIDRTFNWYLFYMFLSYLLAPFIKKLVDALPNILLGIIPIPLIVCGYLTIHTGNIHIGYSRLIVFFIGMYVAKLSMENRRITPVKTCVFFVGVIVGTGLVISFGSDFFKGWNTGILWYPLCMAVVGYCLVITFICQRVRVINQILSFVGKYTYELFLSHILIIDIYKRYFLEKEILQPRIYHWVVIFFVVIGISLILTKIQKLVRDYGTKN